MSEESRFRAVAFVAPHSAAEGVLAAPASVPALWRLEVVTETAEATARLADAGFDAVLVDCSSGAPVDLAAVRAATPATPLIALVDARDERQVAGARAHGAAELIPADRLTPDLLAVALLHARARTRRGRHRNTRLAVSAALRETPESETGLTAAVEALRSGLHIPWVGLWQPGPGGRLAATAVAGSPACTATGLTGAIAAFLGAPAGGALEAVAFADGPTAVEATDAKTLGSLAAHARTAGLTAMVGVPVVAPSGRGALIGFGPRELLRGSQVHDLLLEVSYALANYLARCEAERRLLGVGARWERLVAQVPDVILALDAAFRPRWCNRPGPTVMDPLFGHPDLPHVEAGARVGLRGGFARVLAGGPPERFLVETRPPGAAPTWYSVSVGRDSGVEGQLQGLLLVAQDVTAQRATEVRLHEREAQLRQAQRLESIGRLAGGVAHDFNNVLTGILGFAALLGRTFEAGDPRRDDLDQIVSAARRAADLTRKLLTFGRGQPLEARVFDLNDAVREACRLLERVIGEGYELEQALDPAPVMVDTDQGEIEQVLVNLVVNARDAMPGGGTIRLTTAQQASSPSHPAGIARLTVTDFGCGIGAAHLAKIFDPFFTTKGPGEGTGLGLATAYGIVTQSGGRIDVDSEPDVGTTFTIELPLSARPAGATVRRRTTDANARPGHATVLVAEDDGPLRSLVQRALGEAGYEVLVGESGEAAVAAAQAHDGPIHVVVSDVVMPGMSGPDCVARLREGRSNLGVVYVTGYADAETWDRIQGDPDATLLRKPFQIAELLDAVALTLTDGSDGGE